MKYGKEIFLIFLLALGGLFIWIWVYTILINPEWVAHDTSKLSYLAVYLSLGLGIFLMIYSIILYVVKSEQQKNLNSMSETDLVKMFECPVSGSKSAVQMIKLVKDQILVKQSCPPNKVRLLRIPLRLKDQSIPYFRDAVFRCFKCGQEAAVDFVKTSGPWTLLTLSCPTHGYKQPTHKIWSSIYSDMTKEVVAK
jgi:transcription elongation factor Elf1